MPDEQDRAETSRIRGQVASQIKDSKTRKKFIAEQGERESQGKRDTGPMKEGAYRRRNMNTVEGSFKKGGQVRKTGIYKLHRGERVIPVRSRGRRRR